MKRAIRMRRMMLALALAWCGGFLMAAAVASANTKLKTWREFGADFQLGYVVGYLEAVKLAKRHDLRALSLPSGARVNLYRWRDMVNEFFADPANQKRSVPDAMQAVGKKVFDEMTKSWLEQGARPKASPGTTASPSP